MTFRSCARHFRRLLSGDPMAWRHLPYQLSMKIQGVDLTCVSVKDLGLSEERSTYHSNSGGPYLEKLLDTLSLSQSDTVLDIGCGKGGAMLTLARYPFAQVHGVDISPERARIAQVNIRRLGIQNATVCCRDAADFVDLDPSTYFYMNNPFTALVLRPVLKNIMSSSKRRKRRVTLIYKNPVFNTLVLNAGFHKIGETQRTHPDYPPFSVYIGDGAKWTASLERPADG